MITHMFVFRWKPEVTETRKTEVVKAIRALQGQIPGLLSTRVGRNFSPRSQGFELGGVMEFADREALESYFAHPVHQALLAWLMPLIDAVDVDFEV